VLSKCITILSHFDCSQVAIEFQCIHTYMSFLSLLVWRTKVGIRTGSSDGEGADYKLEYIRNQRIRI